MASETLIEFGKWLFPTLTLGVHIGIVVFLLHALFWRKGFFYKAYNENKDLLLWMAWLVATTATLGSLFYSDIVGYTPCKLCWFERIFMYPQSILLLVAALRKDRMIAVYSIPLSVIGFAITALHYPQQIFQNLHFTQCDAAGGISCGAVYSMSYGYITIPLMAATAFVTISILVFLKRREKN